MKTLKAFISFVCYFGTGIIAIDQVTEGVVKQVLNVNPAAQQIIMYLLIVFWIIKIVWFVLDKNLETQERRLDMRKIEEEIEQIEKNNNKN